jgi:hypothetical protein
MEKVFLNGVIPMLLAGVIFGLDYIGCEKGKMGDYESTPPDGPKIGCDPDNVDCIDDPLSACYKPNEEGIKKCSPDEISLPWDGKWKCKEKDFTVICETDTPGTAARDSGWICYEDEHRKHVCKKSLPRSPGGAPGDESWDCWWDDIGGGKIRRTCVQYPENIWKCYTKDGKEICEREDKPGEGDWKCHKEGEELVCEGTPSGPIDKSWECTKDEYGKTICRKEKVHELCCGPHDKEWICKKDKFGKTICRKEKGPGPGGPHSKGWGCN